MGIPDNAAKFIISGTLGGPEIWATGFFVTGFTTSTFPDNATLTSAVGSGPWAALKTKIAAVLSSGDTVSAVNAYLYQGNAAVRHAVAPYVGTGTGSLNHPKQSCCVMTLRTALATRSGRGRMYFPFTGGSVGGNGLMASTDVNPLVTAVADLLTLYSGSPNTAVVVSQTNTSTAAITSVDADYVPDTQRRRRNKLTSARFSDNV